MHFSFTNHFYKSFRFYTLFSKRIVKHFTNQKYYRISVPIATSFIISSVLNTSIIHAEVQHDVIVPQLVVVESLVEKEKQSQFSNIQTISKEVFHKLGKFIIYMHRICTYLLYGIPFAILTPAAITIGKYVPTIEELAWDYVLWTATRLGPTFIKLAQWASSRPDLYPPKLIERLKHLQDNVYVGYSFKQVEKTLNEAFGENWKEKIDIDPNPIGAGCVAQVFKGKLNGKLADSEGKMVAIKMIHPHVEHLVYTDMELLTMVANFFDGFEKFEMLNLGETFADFGDMMKRQLDLRYEAFNLKTFASKFKADTWVKFPLPIDEFINKNVIVEEYMEGKPMVHFMELPDNKSDEITQLKLKLSDLGVRTILKMIFFDNFVHGDLHPGNMLVNFDDKGKPYIIILDCGIVFQSKSEKDHKRLVDICLAFLQHDGFHAGELMIGNNRSQEDVLSFCNSVQKIVTDTEDQAYFEHIGDYVSRLCDLARIYSVKLDPGYFSIAMALKVVEGVSLGLNRNLDMVTKCVPIVTKARFLHSSGISKFPEPVEADFINTNHLQINKKK